MRKLKRIAPAGALIICLLLTALLQGLTPAVHAAGRIETDRAVKLMIHYADGETPIEGAVYDIYRVADVDAYGTMTLTDAFLAYGIRLSEQDAENWQVLAETLKGYVLRDDVDPVYHGSTDESGVLSASLMPALYLVVGSRRTVDFFTYSAVPFLILLPGSNSEENTWEYEVTAVQKFTVGEELPDDGNERRITRKVLKIWEDSGFEALRPASVTVDLLCDGKVYDTQALSAENNWRYAWDNLSPANEWKVVERTPEGYYGTTDLKGITFAVTNTFIVPYPVEELPVVKRITGHTPPRTENFNFILEAAAEENPMPAGSSGRTKTITIAGTGTGDFGEIVFTKAGSYVYTITEELGSLEGYVYDHTVYTVTYTVTEREGELVVEREIVNNSGDTAEAAVFTNNYIRNGEKLPQTGTVWWPVPLLLIAGLGFLLSGVLKMRRDSHR